jgi:hypothetical protein
LCPDFGSSRLGAPFTINVAAGGGAGTAYDFNRDGKIDLAVASADTITILLGKGDGTFQAPATVSSTVGAVTVAVADINGDGI